MKRFYFLLLTTIAAISASAQGTYSWIGANNADFQVSTNWSPSRTVLNTGDILQFNAGNTRIVTNIPTQTVGELRIYNNSNITFQAPSGAQTLTIANGTGFDFIIEQGSTLTQENTMNNISLAASATADISGTYVLEGDALGDAAFLLGNANVVATVSGTGVIDNRGTISNATAAKLIFQSGATYYHAQNGGTIPTAGWNAASICEVTGVTGTEPVGMGQTFGNFRWNCASQTANTQLDLGSLSTTGTLSIMSTGASALSRIQLASTPVNVNALSISGGNLRIASANSRTLDVATTVTISGGTLTMSTGNGTGTLNVAGNFSFTGGTITETAAGDGLINFDGTTEQSYTKSGSASFANEINATIAANAIVNFGTSVFSGSVGTFTLSSTGKIITSNADGLSNTGTIQTTRVFNSGADYEFRGASTGVFTTAPTANQSRNFVVNNTGGAVALAQAMTTTGALTLTNGYLTTTTNLMTVGAAGTSTSANGAYVNGPLAKIVTAAGTPFTFFTGTTTGGLRSIGITPVTTAGAGSTTFTARFFDASPKTAYANATYSGLIGQISNCEYWTLDRNTGGTKFNSTVTLSWSSASCGGAGYVGNPSTLRVAKHDGGSPGSWLDMGYASSTPASAPYTSGTVTSGTVTAFSPFTIGTSNGSQNPLPVMFADVKAYAKNDGVQIEWSNLTEREITDYIVERSSNGTTFTAINNQSPRSNNDGKESYNHFDASPFSGTNFYRIRVNEMHGKVIYSKVLRVDIGSTKQSFGVYPNPVTGRQFTVSMTNMKQGQYNLKVVNAAGQPVYEARINNLSSSTTQTLELPASIKAGVYTTVLTGADFRESKLFIVQ